MGLNLELEHGKRDPATDIVIEVPAVTCKIAWHIRKKERAMSDHKCKVWGIILAGGEGKRLQSFVQSNYGTDAPKQFCTFTGTRSMLRHTIDRAEKFIKPEQLLTIVSKDHFRYVQDQLAYRPPGAVIVQPLNRETAPAILYSLLHVYQRDPEATVCLFPSDHFVLNEQSFVEHLEFSSEFVTSNPQSIILLGVDPQKSEGGYGWIVKGEQITGNGTKQVYRVSRFVEKPDRSTANQLFDKGNLWNTMIFVGKAKTLLALFKMFIPTVYQAFWKIRDVLGSSLEAQIIKEVYSKLSSVNFSYSILDKNPVGLRTVKLQGAYWNDWGDEDRIRSDIKRFCTVNVAPHVSLPFAIRSDAPVVCLETP